VRPAFRHVLLARLDVPSHPLEHIVLDTASQRLLRVIARSVEATCELAHYVILEHESAPPEEDPSRPDLRLVEELRGTDRAPRRRHLLGWLNELRASERLPPLGIPGPSVAYARFDGTIASLTVLELHGAIITRGRSGEAVLEFAWGPTRSSLPLTKDLEARIAAGQLPHDRASWRAVAGRVPRFALAAYAPPERGYCRKLAVELI